MRNPVRLAKALLSRWNPPPARPGASTGGGDRGATVATPDPDPDPDSDRDPDSPAAGVESEEPVPVPSPTDYLVVYQFGKVASSAIVDSLNRLPGVSAEQSHFLGAEMLQQMLGQLLFPGGEEYFFRHRLGQFVENLRITRELNAFRQGLREPTRLSLVSVTREPLNWLRASLVQDLQGYLPGFAGLGRHWGLPWADEEALIRAVLPRLLGTLAARLEAAGGPDAFLAGPLVWSRLIDGTGDAERDLFQEGFAAMALRPISWFYVHFPAVAGIEVAALEEAEGGLYCHADPGWCDLFVLRYEQVEEGMTRVAERLGLADFRLERVNESHHKPHAQLIAELCAGPEAAALGAQYRTSRYCRRFGYT